MSNPAGPPAQSVEKPRCVLLVGESAAVPSNLVGALDRRGLEIVIARQAPQVMVELAPAGGRDTGPNRNGPANPSAVGSPHGSRSSEGAGQGQASAPDLSLVVVEPQQQPRIGELRQALTAYYPAVRCWQYQARGPEGMAMLDTLHAVDSTPEPPATIESPGSEKLGPPVKPSPAQDLLDTGSAELHTSNRVPAPEDPRESARVKGANQRLRSLVVQVEDPRPYDDGPLVSEDELAMLLGPDDPDPLGLTPSPEQDDSAGKLGISPDSRHEEDGERE